MSSAQCIQSVSSNFLLEAEEQAFVFSAVLKRPLSSSPLLLLGCLGFLAVFCLLIASVWAYLGASWVLVFAGIDVLALAFAAVWCVRHATDFERVRLTQDTLLIERQIANQLQTWRFPRFYVRSALQHIKSGLFTSVRLSVTAQNQQVLLGGFCHTGDLFKLNTQLQRAMKVTTRSSP